MPARTAAAPLAGEDREILRLAGPVAVWWIWLAFVAANVVDFTAQGLPSAHFGAVVSSVLLFVTGLAYTLALRPRVIVDGAGLTVVNPFRTHHVPWRLIQSVDTGEWVRVRYGAGEGAEGPESADTRTVHCWALYVSARARRKIARGNPSQRRGYGAFGMGFGRASRAAEAVSGYASSSGDSRLPEEARALASMPVAKAIASRLDTRAARERARRPRPGQEPGHSNGQAPAAPGAVASSWAWLALAVVVIPALVLLIVAAI
jgi:Bacterial PH domain